jgi:aerobic-type carbon monoxide dehydrogenase small subunit (CoxS/CutS family)
MAEEKSKSGEQENKEESGQISRRAFLKDAGLVVGTPAIGSMVAPAQAEAQTPKGRSAQASVAGSSLEKCPALPHTIELTVNGGKYRYTVEPHWSLRQLLRDEIGFTSPKDWCGGVGACASCTVIMNGRPILSCMTLAVECGGATIETSEGIADDNHPLIEAYIRNYAIQCGYCTPGFVVTAKALLDRNPKPTEADIREALGGNLCKCSSYPAHITAILEAAQELRETKNKKRAS